MIKCWNCSAEFDEDSNYKDDMQGSICPKCNYLTDERNFKDWYVE